MSRLLIVVTALLLSGTVLVPPATAQTPEAFYGIDVNVRQEHATLGYNDQAIVTIVVEDVSREGVEDPVNTTATLHTVKLDARLEVGENESLSAWSVNVARNTLYTNFGETVSTRLIISTSANPTPRYLPVTINATMTADGEDYYAQAQILLIAEKFRAVSALMIDTPPQMGPNEILHTKVLATNVGNYPDTFRAEASGGETVEASILSSFSLRAGESREIPVQIRAADNMFEVGRNEIIRFQFASISNEAAAYTLPMPVQVQGFYLPMWTFPFWVVLVGLAAYGGQRTYEKVRRDRRRYGHPAPKYTDEQKAKLQQLKDKDKDKYKAVKKRLDERYKEQLQAYKERKRKGKARRTGALLKKMDKKRKQQEKLRKSGIKTVKKLKDEGTPPEEIYQALEPGEREQLQGSLPEMLKAPTAAAAVVAARDDDEEMGTIDKMRARKAETEEKRLRAEALLLIEHRREEGYDAEEIRDELSVPQKLALGDDLEFALEGER